MPTRTHALLAAALFCATAAACSHSGSSTTDDSADQTSASGKYAEESPIKSQDAPQGGYSCRHYDPLTNAIYTGAGSTERLEGTPTDAFRREYVERMFHGVHHAKAWHERVKSYAANHDVGDATRRELVRHIRRKRIRDTGSIEAFVRLRLREEATATRKAWQAANDHPQFDLPTTPVSEAELTDEEIAYHRRATTAYLRSLQKERPGLFD